MLYFSQSDYEAKHRLCPEHYFMVSILALFCSRVVATVLKWLAYPHLLCQSPVNTIQLGLGPTDPVLMTSLMVNQLMRDLAAAFLTFTVLGLFLHISSFA